MLVGLYPGYQYHKNQAEKQKSHVSTPILCFRSRIYVALVPRVKGLQLWAIVERSAHQLLKFVRVFKHGRKDSGCKF